MIVTPHVAMQGHDTTFLHSPVNGRAAVNPVRTLLRQAICSSRPVSALLPATRFEHV